MKAPARLGPDPLMILAVGWMAFCFWSDAWPLALLGTLYAACWRGD